MKLALRFLNFIMCKYYLVLILDTLLIAIQEKVIILMVSFYIGNANFRLPGYMYLLMTLLRRRLVSSYAKPKSFITFWVTFVNIDSKRKFTILPWKTQRGSKRILQAFKLHKAFSFTGVAKLSLYVLYIISSGILN